jgi:hypothetical protein
LRLPPADADARALRAGVQPLGCHQHARLVHLFIELHVRREQLVVERPSGPIADAVSTLLSPGPAVMMNRMVSLHLDDE